MDPILEHKLIATNCKHCGDPCLQNEAFCCNGCELVFNLLSKNGLESYYKINNRPGVSQKSKIDSYYSFLDNEKTTAKLLTFHESNISIITLHLPDIHCSSCLWLLENIYKLDQGIQRSTVDFMAKKAIIQFDNHITSLRNVVELLNKIGYPPKINFNSITDSKTESQSDNKLLYQLGLAGFCFGNIMLLSFPEYLGFKHAASLFYIGYINILLAIPVLVYSGRDYLISAYQSIKLNHLNLDVPISLGIIVLFSRSIYEILSHTGEGYLDSFSGFIFFLLIGKWFQDYTYKSLDFNRTFSSYFPISSLVKSGDQWISKTIDQLEIGDEILIKNEDIVPVDSIMTNGKAQIDYSFVTGEESLVNKYEGDTILAGGKQVGHNIQLKVIKKLNQSYLTELWNNTSNDAVTALNTGNKIINIVSKYFTYIIIAIACISFVYWYNVSPEQAFVVFTSVLIVACPCALALSIPFTYGNVLRLLSSKGFFLRNINTIENIQEIDTIIFDKTGTLTDNKKINIEFKGSTLSVSDQEMIFATCYQSKHPLSNAICNSLNGPKYLEPLEFKEHIGAGIEATFANNNFRIGSSNFIFGSSEQENTKAVHISKNNKYLGSYYYKHSLREGIAPLVKKIGKKYNLHMLSGDNNQEQKRMQLLFNNNDHLHFDQSPQDKKQFVVSLQEKGIKSMMIGDGLNDAGALEKSHVGVVVTDNINNFSPSCDAILDAKLLPRFDQIIHFIQRQKYVIYGAIVMALLYNIIGLYFAISGQLSPVIAAILMPLSSLTTIAYGISISYISFNYYLNKDK